MTVSRGTIKKGEKMDGQNFQNGQNNNYQDNTSSVPYQPVSIENNAPVKANSLQIAGLVLGIIAICVTCCYGIPSIILGIIGLVCALKGNKESKHGVGTAGLICSIIGIIAGVIAAAYYIFIIGLMFTSDEFMSILDQYSY